VPQPLRFASQMARVIVSPHKATKLAQFAVRIRPCAEKRRREANKGEERGGCARLRSNAYDGLGTSRSLCAISSIDTSRNVRTLALFTKRAGRYMSQTQASPIDTS
jgi:hypothetical protein